MRTDLFVSPAERRTAAELADLLDGAGRPREDLAPLLQVAGRLRAAAPEAAPGADFRTALRARLVAETAALPTQRGSAPRPAVATQTRPPRLRQAVATAAAVALVGGAGAAVASSSALPGDTLYGLKRGIEAAQLSIAGSDLARGREHLEQADARLGEAEQLSAETPVRAEDRARIGRALTEMDTDVRLGSQLLTDVYRTTGDVEALELLDLFVVDQQRRLDDLLGRLADLDPALAEQARETAALLAGLHAELATLTGGALASTGSAAPVGAARDGRASGDGWAVNRIEQDVARAGVTAQPQAADGPAAAPDAPAQDGGVVDGLTRGSVDAGGLGPAQPGGVAVSPGPVAEPDPVPDVPEPEAGVATLPSVPPADGDPLDPALPDVEPGCGPLDAVLDC